MRTWRNVELPQDAAKKFKEYCRDNLLTYETSECGSLIHFEVLVTDDEANKADDFISARC